MCRVKDVACSKITQKLRYVMYIHIFEILDLNKINRIYVMSEVEVIMKLLVIVH